MGYLGGDPETGVIPAAGQEGLSSPRGRWSPEYWGWEWEKGLREKPEEEAPLGTGGFWRLAEYKRVS